MSNLVLTRLIGETLVIGQDVRVTVVEVRGRAVRLAVEASRCMPVARAEPLAGGKPCP